MSRHLVCCVDSCAIEFCLPNEIYDRRCEDHKVFYCPNGHSQHFAGPSAKEKKIAQLERNLEHAHQRHRFYESRIGGLEHEVRSLRSKLAWAKRRAA